VVKHHRRHVLAFSFAWLVIMTTNENTRDGQPEASAARARHDHEGFTVRTDCKVFVIMGCPGFPDGVRC